MRFSSHEMLSCNIFAFTILLCCQSFTQCQETYELTVPQSVHPITIDQISLLRLNLTWTSPSIDLDLYVYNEGDNFLSFDNFVASGQSQSIEDEVVAVTVPPGNYFVRIDLATLTSVPVDYDLIILANGNELQQRGQCFGTRI